MGLPRGRSEIRPRPAPRTTTTNCTQDWETRTKKKRTPKKKQREGKYHGSMDEESAFGGLLNISLSDDTTETGDAAASAQRAGGDSPPATASSKTDRRVQSEADHQALREKYKAKVANGEVRRTVLSDLLSFSLRLAQQAVAKPLGARALFAHARSPPRGERGGGKQIWRSISLPLPAVVSKPDAQVVLHAVEELYYLRRYREAVDFIHEALGPEGRSDVLDGDVRGTLVHYEGLCVRKLESR